MYEKGNKNYDDEDTIDKMSLNPFTLTITPISYKN